MKSPPVVFFVGIVLAHIRLGAAGMRCGAGEVEDGCPGACADTCPRREERPAPCAAPAPCPPPTCRCRFDYRRVDNGTCVPAWSCPPFPCPGENQEYVACAPLCPGEACPPAAAQCPLFGRLGFVLECRAACRCRAGHCRDAARRCVPAIALSAVAALESND